ncbi:MAG: glycerophosphodiester phosphodiesterase family protein [Janthinobacterium lividum]
MHVQQAMLVPPSLPISSGRVEVHGHRGCRGLLPENTIPAFLHALQMGVDVLELDVIISADNQVVVSHEPWLSSRLGSGPDGQLITPQHERAYNLYRLPYAAIRRCVVGAQAIPGFPQQQICPSYRPLLREVLAATEAACRSLGRPLVRYSVEVKSSVGGDDIYHPAPVSFVELVMTELEVAAVVARTTLLSFDYRILQAARSVVSKPIALCLLSEEGTPAAVLFQQLGFVPDTFGPCFQLLSPEMVQDIASEYPALRIVLWTVNELADLQEALLWPIAGITTDYPNRLLALLPQERTSVVLH